jgi:hypothetical protein
MCVDGHPGPWQFGVSQRFGEDGGMPPFSYCMMLGVLGLQDFPMFVLNCHCESWSRSRSRLLLSVNHRHLGGVHFSAPSPVTAVRERGGTQRLLAQAVNWPMLKCIGPAFDAGGNLGVRLPLGTIDPGLPRRIAVLACACAMPILCSVPRLPVSAVSVTTGDAGFITVTALITRYAISQALACAVASWPRVQAP